MKADVLNIFERLASQASEELPLPTNVADRVLATLQSRQKAAVAPEPLYLIFGVASFITACAAMVLFWLGTGDDTLIALVQPFMTVLP